MVTTWDGIIILTIQHIWYDQLFQEIITQVTQHYKESKTCIIK